MIILNKEQKLEIEKSLNKLGINKLNYILTQTGREKLRAFSGSLIPEEIFRLHNYIYIETIGLYIAKIEKDGVRLSLDGSHILKPDKNILELNEAQANSWMKGEDLNLESLDLKDKEGYIVIKHKEDFLGSGKIGKEKLINFLPKERRVR